MSSKKKKTNSSAIPKSQFRIGLLLQRSKSQQHVARSFSHDNSVLASRNSTLIDNSTNLENDDGFLFKRSSTGMSLSDDVLATSKLAIKPMHSSKAKILKAMPSSSRTVIKKKPITKKRATGPIARKQIRNKKSSSLLDIGSDSDDKEYVATSGKPTIKKVEDNRDKIIESRNKLRDLAKKLMEVENSEPSDSKNGLIRSTDKLKLKTKKRSETLKLSPSKRRTSSIIPEKDDEDVISEPQSKGKKTSKLQSLENKRLQSTKRKKRNSNILSNLGVAELNKPHTKLHEIMASEKGIKEANKSSPLKQKLVKENLNSVSKDIKKTNELKTSEVIKDSNNSVNKKFKRKKMLSPGIKQPLKLSPVKRSKTMANNRRSSLGNRGKRTSSVGNGFQVSPHEDIPPLNFYKHLNQDLPEPYRMRQLLAWCLKRQLDYDKKNDDTTSRRSKLFNNDELIAKNIATVIKEEVIRDLADGKINTSWWNRENYDEEIIQPVKKKPKIVANEQNEENLKTLKILENRLSRLKKENNELDKLSDKYKNELQVADVIDSDNSRSEEFIRNYIKKDILKNQRKSLADDTTKEFYHSLINESKVDKSISRTSDLMSDIRQNYIGTLCKLDELADKLNYNESSIKNFQYSKNRQLSRVIKKYINKSFVDNDIESTDAIKKGFDNINLLKGISRIDKS